MNKMTYCAKYREESRREFVAHSASTSGEDSQGESQRPPSHVEREFPRRDQRGHGKGKPNQAECPQ